MIIPTSQDNDSRFATLLPSTFYFSHIVSLDLACGLLSRRVFYLWVTDLDQPLRGQPPVTINGTNRSLVIPMSFLMKNITPFTDLSIVINQSGD